MSSTAHAVILLLLPVMTGLQSTLWSQVIGFSRSGGAVVNIVGSLILGVILWRLYPQANSLQALFQGNNWITTTVYLFVSIFVALLWVLALQVSSIAIIGFVEIGYPLFIVLFAYLLVGKVEMTATHWIGAGMILVGTLTVVFANHR